MDLIIEAGKFYLKTEEGYVVDAVEYNPDRLDYVVFQATSIPSDILNRCYQLIDNELVLDLDKHALFIEEQSKDTRIKELEEKIKTLQSEVI